MIPLRDHNPSHETPIITYILILLNVLVFLYMSLLPDSELNGFVYQYALIPSLVWKGEQMPSYLTSLFLHGGFLHLLGNMWFLYIFGDNIEARFGRFQFLLLYLACGIAGSFTQVLLHTSSIVPNLGASGAIAGVLGSYLVFFPNARIETLVPFGFYSQIIIIPAYYMLGYWIAFQILFGISSVPSAQANMGGVAYFAHIGGFVTGYLFSKYLQKQNWNERWN